MIHPLGTRFCGEMRGSIPTDEREGSRLSAESGLGQVGSTRGVSLDGRICKRHTSASEWTHAAETGEIV